MVAADSRKLLAYALRIVGRFKCAHLAVTSAMSAFIPRKAINGLDAGQRESTDVFRFNGK
jgi:hypothetical protein